MRLSEYASTRKTRGSYKMPRSVQQSIPIDRIYADGVWQSENVFSLMWQISDINYAMQSDAAKQNILMQLGTVYAGIPADCWMQVCIVSQRMDEKAFARDVLYHRENDGFDALRAERNRQIKANARENGNVVQHKYIIVSTNKPGVKEARERFVQVQGHLLSAFSALECAVTPLDNRARLEVLHKFFRISEEGRFNFEFDNCAKLGQDFRDSIAPDCIRFCKKHIEIEDFYAKCMTISEYPQQLDDKFISALLQQVPYIVLSIDIEPVETEDAFKEIDSAQMKTDAEKVRFNKKSVENLDFTSSVPQRTQEQDRIIANIRKEMTENDQQMFLSLLTVTYFADTLEDLALTREAVRRYLQKQTATTAAGNTAPIVTHAPKLPTISSKQATVEAISRGVHYIAAKIKALLSQTVRHAAQSLLALLGAGGVVLLLAMVIGAAAAVIGSPMGILFADESGDPNSIPIAEIVADTNADFGAAINDIVSAHPECSETTITYDYEDGHTWASYWPEVLAIFAVHTNLNSDSDVVVINAAQMQRIQDTFWAMHEITYEVEEVDTTPEPTEDDPDPEQQTDYILHITVSSKTVDELAELYNFTQDQKDILHQLLSEEMRPSLLALCGGIAVADGELCWPLPGHTYISCHFGEVDAFGNAGHRGTDIPAPESTPILAAHSGTVLVSGWNDSYGNQVLLDNGAGLSTRYAHMTQTAVTAGEAVTAGQVIGYVGSTGDSTGNHLHFEVMQNGVRMNPLELVFAQ